MSTSDSTPPGSTPNGNTHADDQRIDRLYRASQDAGARDDDATSPADLDDLIRASARSSQTPEQSSYWNWQQRFGWATAAAVVLTSALFITLPDTAPEVIFDADSERSPHAGAPPPTPTRDFPSDSAAPQAATLEDQVPAVVPVLTPKPQPAPSQAKTIEQLAPEADAGQRARLLNTRQKDVSAPKARREAYGLNLHENSHLLEELVATDSATNSICEPVGDGLIERICSVPGNPLSYTLHPNQASPCNSLTLDELHSRPVSDAASNADQFVYNVGKLRFSATCQVGGWVVQSIARGR